MKLFKTVRPLYRLIFSPIIRFSARYPRLSRTYHSLCERYPKARILERAVRWALWGATPAIDFRLDPRKEMFERAMGWALSTQLNGLNGDYLEFGTFKGFGFAQSFYWAKRWGLNSMKFYAFDSFQGLPPPKDIDVTPEFHQGGCSYDLDSFKRNISEAGVDLSRVIITHGWFNEVLNEETKKKLEIKVASVVLIDCDLYESTVPVLDFITDYLVEGTLLMFSGWFAFRGDPDRGEQRAVREWLKKTPDIKLIEYHKFFWLGNSFIVHRGSFQPSNASNSANLP